MPGQVTIDSAESKRREMFRGIVLILPFLVGAAPFGFAFGAMGISAGLSPVAVQGLSLFVFAGSSQFLAVSLMAAGASLPVIFIGGFFVNLRHLFYSSALRPLYRCLPLPWLGLLSFTLTDETYAVVATEMHAGRNHNGLRYVHLGSGILMYINWQIWTLAGIVSQSGLGSATDLGLDFAFPVTFIGVVVPMLKDRNAALAATVSGSLATWLHSWPNGTGFLLAATSGIGIALARVRGAKRRSL